MGYEKSKIYKLLCEDGHYYYGSTIATLSSRLCGHKSSCKTMTSKLYTHIKSIGWDNVKIELIELFACENREQLRKKENEYINKSKEDILCLNTLPAYKSDKEKHDRALDYYVKNKDDILVRNENYRKVNLDKVTAQRNKNYQKTRDEQISRMKEYNKQNLVTIREQRKQFYHENKERLCKEKRERRNQMNKEELKNKRREYRVKNRERINELKRNASRKKALEILQSNE